MERRRFRASLVGWCSLGLLLALAMSCSDSGIELGAGGASAGGGGDEVTSSSSSSSGMVVEGPCYGEPNGICGGAEDCACADCANVLRCGGVSSGAGSGGDGGGGSIVDCTDDGECADDESCVCPDCDVHGYCGDPADYNCTDDGTCDGFDEGCNCVDCYGGTVQRECIDNVAACNDGVPDDACDSGEDCGCPDCIGTPACVPCEDDDACDLVEGCHCADCVSDPFCTDEDNCTDDGVCGLLYEGCVCADCADEPACTG